MIFSSASPATRSKMLSKNSKRLLDFVHLVFAGLWLGGFIILLGLSLMSTTGAADASFGPVSFAAVRGMIKICIPALMLTGILYGLLTNWGFKKHGWVVVKWVLSTAIAACTALAPAKPVCLAGVVVGMLALFAISVFKPSLGTCK